MESGFNLESGIDLESRFDLEFGMDSGIDPELTWVAIKMTPKAANRAPSSHGGRSQKKARKT